jgi:hypothetical protein
MRCGGRAILGGTANVQMEAEPINRTQQISTNKKKIDIVPRKIMQENKGKINTCWLPKAYAAIYQQFENAAFQVSGIAGLKYGFTKTSQEKLSAGRSTRGLK